MSKGKLKGLPRLFALVPLTIAQAADMMTSSVWKRFQVKGGKLHLRHRATIEDVATHAGVGVGTVSRVLNRKQHVSQSMRERVEAAIVELDYRPSQLARSLSKGSSDIVSVVAPHITRPSVVARIDSCLAELNRVGVVASLFGVFNRKQFDQVIDALSDRHSTTALVVVSIPVTKAQVSALQRANVSIFGLDVKVTTADSVFIDNVFGGAMVGSHLLDQGYRRIGFIGDLDFGNFTFTSSHARLRGLKGALQKGGLQLEPENVKFCEHGTSSAKDCAMRLLMSNSAPDAIFASSDTGALGVLSAATELGVSIPDDLGVVGFDNLEMAEVVGLSSVSQPLSLSGEIIAERVIARLTQKDAHPVHTLLDLHLVKRASTLRACNLTNFVQPAKQYPHDSCVADPERTKIR